jgi:hypothetical protein
MSTLAPLVVVVNHLEVSVADGPPVDVAATSGQGQSASVVSIAIVLLLLILALKRLGAAVQPIGELVRLVMSALAVAVLLLGAMAVLVWMLIGTAGAR